MQPFESKHGPSAISKRNNMRWLTYADRELLLDTFDALKDKSGRTTHELLAEVSEWARGVKPSFGFEHQLLSDVTTLSKCLLDHESRSEIAEIARGGLLYVLCGSEGSSVELHRFGLLDDAFVVNYAVQEIQKHLGISTTYGVPRLSQAEQSQAETLFLDFIDRPVLPDHQLLEQAQRNFDRLSSLASYRLFARMTNNIRFLISVLQDSERSLEHRAYARGALSYLVRTDDAIDDRFGLVGHLDDGFIAQVAVDLIEPSRDPLLEIIDFAVDAWPFLDRLAIDDSEGGRPLSEFMLVNAALLCPAIRGQGFRIQTAVVLPSAGPIPFLLGLIAALSLIHDHGKAEIAKDAFRPGQKVLVDNSSVAEFVGIEVRHGCELFGLRQYRTSRGQRLESIRYWPISELKRLTPVNEARVLRGQLSRDRTDLALPGLDYLFDANNETQFRQINQKVMVVTPVAIAHEMASEFSLYGHPLRNVLPMGHISSSSEIHRWSTRFGQQDPILLFASDLDTACIEGEKEPERNRCVVVDASGRNATRLASLKRLQHFKVPTLLIAEERDVDDLGLGSDNETAIWEWSEADLSALLWPQAAADAEGPIARYERRLLTHLSEGPEVHVLVMPLATEIFAVLRQLNALARERAGDRLAELEEIIGLTFSAFFKLLRFSASFSHELPSKNEIQETIDKAREIRDRSLFLSQAETNAARSAEDSLREFCLQLTSDNPKARLVSKLLAADENLSIICPDASHCRDLEVEYSQSASRIRAGCSDDVELEGAIIPGWFGRDRMRKLLVPPVTQPLILVLYEVEARWYQGFLQQRRKSHEARSQARGRRGIFPAVRGWHRAVEKASASEEEDNTSLQQLDSIQQHLHGLYRQRVYKAVRSEGSELEVSARLVIFEGERCAFFTDSYHGNVVTHLIDDYVQSEDDKADLRQMTVRELRIGDALLVHRGSARDVIRSAADKILPLGVRDTASLWQTALLRYVLASRFSSERLWETLQSAGCPLQHQTIRTWLENEDIIGPQAYGRDVPIIAQVTQDGDLVARLDAVITAIGEVRSAHLRASHQLAKQVLARAASSLRRPDRRSEVMEIEEGVVVVRILEIEKETTLVRVSLSNRLLESEHWHQYSAVI
jgi:uncharacterized membrane protein YkvA (DUF1232 family)